MRLTILIILCISISFIMKAQPLSSDGDYTNLEIGVISCKDTLNFVQYKDYTITSLNNRFNVDIKILKDGIEDNYNKSSGARSINYIDNSKHPFFVSRYNSRENVLKVIIIKRRKKMIVLFKITEHRDYIPWNIKMYIPFKKGTYEVSNPKNPKLLKI